MTTMHSVALRIFHIVLVLTIAGCVRGAPKQVNVAQPVQNTFYKPSQIEVEVLARVNAVRATGYRCGSKYLPPVGKLQINEELSMAALRQARDMATTNFFSHAGINGNTAGDRISAAGYTWSTYGENIAAGQRTPNHAVDSWLKSPGHCANIMNGNFQEMGVASATYKASKFKIYWVQTFGAR